jgi:hypothetical protein
MELLLNSVWALVAAISLYFWFRLGFRAAADRTVSFVALAMLLIILFPVISVSDDLWSVQNPAETDTCQRRDHRVSCPHSVFPATAALPGPGVADFPLVIFRVDAPRHSGLLLQDNPALDPIQNRPPPTA